tara:strand:+ start:518 stop:1891 length:1374 start_codon:yes stop_codon:yes gene_type:complete
MPKPVDGTPSPKSLIKTLMRVGYDFNMAVGDIVDNSISADAKNIRIFTSLNPQHPTFSIYDDGWGMSEKELYENMKLAAKDPSLERDKNDLGRFGSGMKTASFSQARKLIVISKKKGSKICGAYWDIDEIESSDSWEVLMGLSEKEINSIDGFDKDMLSETGTVIIWHKIISFRETQHTSLENIIANTIDSMSRYLSLHFHKFIQSNDKVSFFVNQRKLSPINPFIKGKGSMDLTPENIRGKKGNVEIKPHVLPHPQYLSQNQIDKLGGIDAIYKNQGLYIYRANRLIIAGGWMGLSSRNILGNLARVEVNIPASLDDEWSTDVKKSSLQLPIMVQKKLKQICQRPIGISRGEHTHRGKKEEVNEYWFINENKQDNTTKYEVHLKNNELVEIAEKMTQTNRIKLKEFLRNLSKYLPVNHIFSRIGKSPKSVNQENALEGLPKDLPKDIEEKLRKLWG